MMVFFLYLHKSVKIAIFALYSLDFNLYWLSPQLVLGMIKTACIEWTPLKTKKIEDTRPSKQCGFCNYLLN